MGTSRGPSGAAQDGAPAVAADAIDGAAPEDARVQPGDGGLYASLQTDTQFGEHLARHLSLAARKTSTFVVILIEIEPSPDEALLGAVVDRLREQMRSHEMLALHAAGTLVALLEDCSEAQAAAAVERLGAAIVGEDASVRPRFGAAVAPTHGRTPQAVMEAVGEALATARKKTSPQLVFFQTRMMRGRARVEGGATDEVLAALNEDQVALALQPIVHAGSRIVAFYEGLVRIRRNNGELVMPDTMVPHAEKHGIVSLLDRRVIELAFGLLTSDRKLHLSVNASVTSLGDPRWVDQLRNGCRLRPDAARRLTVEITETRAVADIEATRETLTTLKPLGIKIAIDDFGSGHSSFRNLRQLPVDYLKIDGAFAQNLASSADDRFFTRALVDLARNLSIPTVAEWVEDEETAQLLTDWGVAYLQGHLFGRAELVPPPAGTKRIAR